MSFLSPSNQPARMSARHLWPARRRRQAKSASRAQTWPFSHQFVSGKQRREACSALPTTTTTITNPTRAGVEATTRLTGNMRRKSIVCQSALHVTHCARLHQLRVFSVQTVTGSSRVRFHEFHIPRQFGPDLVKLFSLHSERKVAFH